MGSLAAKSSYSPVVIHSVAEWLRDHVRHDLANGDPELAELFDALMAAAKADVYGR